MATVTFASAAAPHPGAAAYACSRLGFRVFPLRRDTGTPVFTEWPERASADAAQIKAWWSGTYAGCGVGIATGPASGIWVLDIDVKDADGFSSLRELTLAHGGSVDDFMRTMAVRTPSGGAHVYFRWDEASAAEGGVRNSAKQLAPGLDVRGIRGYVRAPEVGAYRIVERSGVKATAVTSAPGWLVGLCKQRRSASTDPMTNADIRYRISAGGQKWGRFQAAESVRRLGRSPAGTRNDNLNKTAYRLGKLSVAFGEPTREDALRECLATLAAAGAGDSIEAQERTFTSGWEAGRAKAKEAAAAAEQPVPET
jgi:hypothetical protein